jgi:hypothetical protein
LKTSTVVTRAAASASVAARHVEVLLGVGATVPAISTPAVARTPSAVIRSTGPAGGAVTAQNGVPCVD